MNQQRPNKIAQIFRTTFVQITRHATRDRPISTYASQLGTGLPLCCRARRNISESPVAESERHALIARWNLTCESLAARCDTRVSHAAMYTRVTEVTPIHYTTACRHLARSNDSFTRVMWTPQRITRCSSTDRPCLICDLLIGFNRSLGDRYVNAKRRALTSNNTSSRLHNWQEIRSQYTQTNKPAKNSHKIKLLKNTCEWKYFKFRENKSYKLRT